MGERPGHRPPEQGETLLSSDRGRKLNLQEYQVTLYSYNKQSIAKACSLTTILASAKSPLVRSVPRFRSTQSYLF